MQAPASSVPWQYPASSPPSRSTTLGFVRSGPFVQGDILNPADRRGIRSPPTNLFAQAMVDYDLLLSQSRLGRCLGGGALSVGRTQCAPPDDWTGVFLAETK